MTPTSTSSAAPRAGNGAPQAAPQPNAPRILGVRSFGLTDIGKKRRTNQDQFVTATLMRRALWIEQSSLPQSTVYYASDRGHVLMVADGMGGHAAGEKASAIAALAVESFLVDALRWVLTLDEGGETGALRDFKEALRNADAHVCGAAHQDPKLSGMGTTLTLAYSRDTDLFVAHAGDSRCYLLRGGVLGQITRDHTLVQQMVETGLIKPEEAADNDFRHVVTNVVGGPEPGVNVEVHRLRLEPGDMVLLCTDGLTGMVPNATIAEVLETAASPELACKELVKRANDAGGDDNITVVVAQYAYPV